MESKIVGILGQIFIACTLTGGGQLGRMLAAAATRLNIDVVILETGENSPAKQVVSSPHIGHVDGSFSDPAKIRELASKVDILTVEIEHVNVSILEEIQSSTSVQVHPSPATIRTIQDKYLQKQHLQAHGIAVADFTEVESTPSGVELAGELLDWPLMLKSKTLAYDGRGNYVLKSISEAHSAILALGNRPLYAERLMPLKKEIAVMVVRSLNGEIASYPAVETIHKDNICHLVYAPLRQVSPDVTRRAKMLAENAVRTFRGAGIFGVEMFLLDDDTLLVNEIAPRPHNSGHYTIEACYTSQYENHLRAILSLPLGSTSMKVHSSVMLNLLGTTNDMKDITRVAQKALKIPGASVHLYGKKECRKGRKMGHITLTAESDAEIRERLRPLLEELPDATSESITQQAPLVPPPKSGKSAAFPLVGIIMGSDSDLPVMLPAARILDDFRVPYELTIVSAHRTPDRMTIYAREAASRGLRAIIAGAGGAAHLPGMVAAMTSLPVIGVPVKGSSLDGVDSLHSIVQMPRGIPVATVAINNSTNAALLAVRILASHSEQYLKAMDKYSKDLENQVMGKVEKLGEVGWETYRP